MRSKAMSRLALACLGLLSAGSFSAAQTTTQPASQEEAKKQLVALVDKAAELVASKGEEAFAEFRKPGSEWKHDEVYIFVTRSDGMAVVHPTLEGQNMLDLKDTEGKLIVRDMMKAVETQDSGWTEYMWPKPGATEPSKKSSYVRKVKSGDATYIVGAGVYLD